MNASPEELARQKAVQQLMIQIARQEKDDKEADKKIHQALDVFTARLTPEEQKEAAKGKGAMDGQIKMVLTPWFRFFLTYDPVAALEKVRCPVLAINGEKDTQVIPRENLQAIEKALKVGGNKDYTVKLLPRLNHLFQTCTTGAPSEYGKIEETIAPAA